MQARFGAWGLSAAGMAGCLVALLAYFRTASGVDHTAGALIVVVSTAALAFAAAALAAIPGAPAWLRAVLFAGCLLDIAGTAVAAWFLHAWALLAVMALAALAWVAALVSPRGRRAAA